MLKQVQNIFLPTIASENNTFLDEITQTLRVPREIIASDREISKVWGELPEELSLIPREYLNPTLARMCIAVRTGLFDSALNYIWNTTVISLREKLKKFGLGIAASILNKNISENHLNEIQDADLLTYCLELNLISEDGYFFLNQCRDIRNNYSTAHPVGSGAMIDRHKLLSFLHDCIQYSFNDDTNLVGVDVKLFMDTIKNTPLDDEAIASWETQIKKTNTKQKQALIKTLYGIYCDKDVNEVGRKNSEKLLEKCKDILTSDILASILCQYQEYELSGKTEKIKASNILFEKLELLKYLPESKQCLIFSKAVDNLMMVHNSFNNFYNEPPFAERLFELSSQLAVPPSIQRKFVETVALCSVGNPYGVSQGAIIYYDEMIKNFSPLEIKLFFTNLADSNSYFSRLTKTHKFCNDRLKIILQIIDRENIPVEYQTLYDKIKA